MESNASLRIKTIRRDQKRPERMKRPEQKFRAFHSFGPYWGGGGGPPPPPPPEALPFSLLLRFGEVGVDHIVVGFLAASRASSGLGARGTGGVSPGLLALSLRVELFGQLVRSLS